MTHQNLVLTEEAIKAHCKRLHKELKNLNQELPLTQVQNLLSKAFGFNHFHELKKVLINQQELKHPFDEIVDSYYNVFDNNQYFKILIFPENKMDKNSQTKLIELINTVKLGNKEQDIKILKIEMNEEFCLISLDPNSKFSELNYNNEKGERILGITIAGFVHPLISKICDYLKTKGNDKYHHVEYAYKIKNNKRIFIHLEDLILERDLAQ